MTTALTDATAMPSAYTQPGTSTFAPLQTEIARTTAAVQTFIQERRIQTAEISEQNRRLTDEFTDITAQNAAAEHNHLADMAELQELVNGVRAAITENQTVFKKQIASLKKPIPPEPALETLKTVVRLRKNPPELNRFMTNYYAKLEQYNKDLELYNKLIASLQMPPEPVPPEKPDLGTVVRLRKNPPELNRLMTNYYTKLEQYTKDMELYNESLLQAQNSQ
jgi:tetratricopeptide (TPR) repeat protein